MVARLLLACALIAVPVALPAQDRSVSHHGDLFGGGTMPPAAGVGGGVRLGGTGSVRLGGAGSIPATRRIAPMERPGATISTFVRRGGAGPFETPARAASEGVPATPAAGAGDASDGLDPQ